MAFRPGLCLDKGGGEGQTRETVTLGQLTDDDHRLTKQLRHQTHKAHVDINSVKVG